jgi:hypothetical protein
MNDTRTVDQIQDTQEEPKRELTPEIRRLIEQLVDQELKDREPTAEDLEWFASRFKA